ncbi:hypothetical protein AB0L06_41030 [Spirillospora sp. NPDC052269]
MCPAGLWGVVWYSTDEGANWTAAQLKRDSDGHYTATATYPALAATTGAVSLKVEAHAHPRQATPPAGTGVLSQAPTPSAA